ncbi:hypothetical protein QFZ42_003333 [Variovorax paradoxus]|uniref:hypothetical protein n=1 Tax=Variovorax paradoxus TaxID=34073 RepID=UPI00279048A6|nr:hypothetical protein [Variovorax paradoxus]MDQ0571499.1 hypothetical protein [Variovorax paradoxus]
MNTITLWLLIASGTSYAPARVVERFVSPTDCQEARARIDKASTGRFECVEAKVYKP